MKRLVLLLSIIFVAVGLSGCGYNQIQSNDEAVIAAWGDVEASYQRRADLIPNLVEVVKGYAAHEKETLTAVVEARAQATQTQVSADQLTPETMSKLSSPMNLLKMVITE